MVLDRKAELKNEFNKILKQPEQMNDEEIRAVLDEAIARNIHGAPPLAELEQPDYVPPTSERFKIAERLKRKYETTTLFKIFVLVGIAGVIMARIFYFK